LSTVKLHIKAMRERRKSHRRSDYRIFSAARGRRRAEKGGGSRPSPGGPAGSSAVRAAARRGRGSPPMKKGGGNSPAAGGSRRGTESCSIAQTCGAYQPTQAMPSSRALKFRSCSLALGPVNISRIIWRMVSGFRAPVAAT